MRFGVRDISVFVVSFRHTDVVGPWKPVFMFYTDLIKEAIREARSSGNGTPTAAKRLLANISQRETT